MSVNAESVSVGARKPEAYTTPALLAIMDLANLPNQPTRPSDLVNCEGYLYDTLYKKIQKMTETEIRKRENEIYQNNLSCLLTDRQEIYMELGIIISVLRI